MSGARSERHSNVRGHVQLHKSDAYEDAVDKLGTVRPVFPTILTPRPHC